MAYGITVMFVMQYWKYYIFLKLLTCGGRLIRFLQLERGAYTMVVLFFENKVIEQYEK